MRRRSKILLLAACVLIAAIAVCFFCLRANEPSYNGGTLSGWLERPQKIGLQPIGQAEQLNDVATAVRAIGTNAVPALLSWSGAKDSLLHKFIAGGMTNLPVHYRPKWVTRMVSNASEERKHGLAESGFHILGTNALQALPELERRFQATTNGEEADLAVRMMQYLGKNAFDFFVEAAQRSPDEFHTRLAAHGIGTMASEMTTNAMPAVPVLLQIAQNRHDGARVRAITAMGQLQLQPELVVPAMTNQMSVAHGRYFVIWTLGQFGPQARCAIPLLTNALHDRDLTTQSGARYALMKIAPEILTNSPQANR
jgi:hypothetical protein